MTDPRALTRVGKYELVKLLGEGAMGMVYQARDPHLDRMVALKLIRTDILGGRQAAQMIARFRNEAMAAGRLQHPGIVAVYDYGEDEGGSFIVMELAPGEDLEVYAEKRAPLPLPEIGALMLQLLDALGYAHGAGVVHRDIKPSNLLVSSNGRVKVTDFGIARLDSSSLTQTGTTLGTPSYMAPEQYSGLVVDPRADLFSVGVIIYELVTGRKPFIGQSLQEVAYKICHVDAVRPTTHNPKLPPAVDGVVLNALAKEKEARFATAQEFSRAIAEVFGGILPAELDPLIFTSASIRRSAIAAPAAVGPEEIDKAVQALVSHVGPIARVLVRKAASQARDFPDLCRKLTEHLPEADRAPFLKKLGIR